MGLFDSILGRSKPVRPDLDAIFGLPSAAITQASVNRTAAPPSTTRAMRTRSKRWALRAIVPDTTAPATPIRMYVAGSHAEP